MAIGKKETKVFAAGAAVGGILGAVTALLLAPKAGRELRKDISSGAHQAGETVAKAAGQVTETTGRIAREIGSRTAAIAARTKEAASSVSGVFGKSSVSGQAASGTADGAPERDEEGGPAA